MTVARSTKHASRKMTMLQTAAVTIIAFTIVIAVFYYVGLFNEFQNLPDQTSSTPTTPDQTMPSTTTPDQATLSPARNLEGTWKTAFAVKFYIKTDFETGELQDVGSENRAMTWIITETSDENVVDVEVSFTSSNRQLTADSGYTPDVSPVFLTGTISGTRLTLTTGGSTFEESHSVGTFSFTTDIITGTWDDQWSLAYGQEVYTTTNSLKLSRQ